MPQSVCLGRANVTIAFGFCMPWGCLLATNPWRTFFGCGVTGSQAFTNWHHFFSIVDVTRMEEFQNVEKLSNRNNQNFVKGVAFR